MSLTGHITCHESDAVEDIYMKRPTDCFGVKQQGKEALHLMLDRNVSDFHLKSMCQQISLCAASYRAHLDHTQSLSIKKKTKNSVPSSNSLTATDLGRFSCFSRGKVRNLLKKSLGSKYKRVAQPSVRPDGWYWETLVWNLAWKGNIGGHFRGMTPEIVWARRGINAKHLSEVHWYTPLPDTSYC